MSEPLYRPILKKSISLAWKNKVLWIFGFFAAFLGGSSQYDVLINQFSQIRNSQFGFEQNFFASLGSVLQSNLVQTLVNIAKDTPSGSYIAIAVILVAVVFFIWLTIISQASLLHSYTQTEEKGSFRLAESIKKANKNFWQLLFIIISTRTLAFLIFALAGIPLLLLIYQIVNSTAIFTFGLFVIGSPLFIIFSIIAKFAFMYKTHDDLSWTQSLISAIKLFGGHWLISIEIAFILFVVNIIAGLGIFILFLILLVPFVLLGTALAQTTFAAAIPILAVFGLAFLVLLGIILGSAVSAYHQCSWALLFLKIRTKKRTAKIIRTLHAWRENYSK